MSSVTICNVVTIIPMRSGSVRFPNKHLFKIYGKELYKYTLEHAEALGFPAYIRHDYEPGILEIPDFFTEKVFKNISSDNNLSEDIKKVVDADIYVLLQVTSPLRNVHKLRLYIDNFIQNKDLLCGIGAYKLKDAYYYNENANYLNFNLERHHNNNKKKPVYRETGSFYFFRRSMLDKNHITATTQKKIYEDPFDIDIDKLEDVFYMQRRYRNFFNRSVDGEDKNSFRNGM